MGKNRWEERIEGETRRDRDSKTESGGEMFKGETLRGRKWRKG